MLVLTRELGERIRLKLDAPLPVGEEIWLEVTDLGRGYVRLGLDAPRAVEILREEIIHKGARPEVLAS